MTRNPRRWLARHEGWLRVLAFSLWLAVTGSLILSLGSWATGGFPLQPASWVQGAIGVSAIALVSLAYATAGVLLANRAPRNPMGWILLAIGIAMGLVVPLNQLLEGVIHSVRPVDAPLLYTAWLASSAHLPGAVVAAIFVVMLCPTGRPEGRHWRPAAVLALSGFVLLSVSTALRPDGLLWYPTLPNPLGTPAAIGPLVVVGMIAGAAALIGALVVVATGLASRYRHAHAVERRHLALLAVGGAIMAATLSILFVARYMLVVEGDVGEGVTLLASVGSIALPLALVSFVRVTAVHGREIDDLTFLFTDLQGSTRMYEQVGDASAFVLVRRHFDILESTTRAHGGVVVKNIGDAVMARFDDPASAVAAALAMQERIERLSAEGEVPSWLGIRIGLHRGPAIAVTMNDRIDYFGQTVNAAARIQALAPVGDITLSDDVYRGVGVADLLADREITSQHHSLRGVAEELLLYRVPGSRIPTAPSGTADEMTTAVDVGEAQPSGAA